MALQCYYECKTGLKNDCCQIHHSEGRILFVSRVDVVPSAQIIDLCLKIDFASKKADT